jgi:hypothetical protein
MHEQSDNPAMAYHFYLVVPSRIFDKYPISPSNVLCLQLKPTLEEMTSASSFHVAVAGVSFLHPSEILDDWIT